MHWSGGMNHDKTLGAAAGDRLNGGPADRGHIQGKQEAVIKGLVIL